MGTASFDVLFQSTLPRGERQIRKKGQPASADFNPRSREGSDSHSPIALSFRFHFNPRSREGSDLAALEEHMDALTISIHAPARGATPMLRSEALTRKFQSTLPRGERQERVDCPQMLQQISIHAPARGATAKLPKYLVRFSAVCTFFHS